MDKTNLQKLISQTSQNQSNSEFDVDNWVQDLEDGFLKWDKLNPELKDGYWGQGREHRPHIREMNVESDAQRVEGYRVVEFFPDREDRTDSYLLLGTPLELMTQISILINVNRMIKRHSFEEQWVGYPLNEYLRAYPRNEIAIQVHLCTTKTPPYYKKKEQFFKHHYLTIPAIDKNTFSYEAIRKACGGDTGLNWGEYSARAFIRLEGEGEKGIHQMVCGGSTKQKAKDNLKKFLPFCKGKVTKITVNNLDLTEGDITQDPDVKFLSSYDVYPSWICVLNSKLADFTYKKGRLTNAGKQVNKRSRKLYIYPPKAPTWWNDILRANLKNPITDKED